MVKAAVMAGAGNRGGGKTRHGEEIDYGLPLTHPAVMIPIIGLIIMGTVALVTFFCKCLPHLVPESFRIFGKRSAEQTVELQLRPKSPRRSSEGSQVSGKSHGRNNRSSKTPSFNTKGQNPNLRPNERLQQQNSRPGPMNDGKSQLTLDIESGKFMTHGKDFTPPPSYEAIKECPERLEKLV